MLSLPTSHLKNIVHSKMAAYEGGSAVSKVDVHVLRAVVGVVNLIKSQENLLVQIINLRKFIKVLLLRKVIITC